MEGVITWSINITSGLRQQSAQVSAWQANLVNSTPKKIIVSIQSTSAVLSPDIDETDKQRPQLKWHNPF